MLVQYVWGLGGLACWHFPRDPHKRQFLQTLKPEKGIPAAS